MALGNIALALGDALLSGNQAYQAESDKQKQETRQKMLDQAALQQQALNMALAQKASDLDAAKFAAQQQQQKTTNALSVLSGLPDKSVITPDQFASTFKGTPFESFLSQQQTLPAQAAPLTSLTDAAKAQQAIPQPTGNYLTTLPVGSKVALQQMRDQAGITRATIGATAREQVAADTANYRQAELNYRQQVLEARKAFQAGQLALAQQKMALATKTFQNLVGWRNDIIKHMNNDDEYNFTRAQSTTLGDPSAIPPPTQIPELPEFDPMSILGQPTAPGGPSTTTNPRPAASPVVQPQAKPAPFVGGLQVDASNLPGNTPAPPAAASNRGQFAFPPLTYAGVAADRGIAPFKPALTIQQAQQMTQQPPVSAATSPATPPPQAKGDDALRTAVAMLLQKQNKPATPAAIDRVLHDNPQLTLNDVMAHLQAGS